MPVEKTLLHPVVKNNKNIAVVFIHGLNGDVLDTWKRERLDQSLPELLGHDEELKEFDFYSYGYKTGLKPSQYDFSTVAEVLYSDIKAQLGEQDIVFVAHSMGGLVVQQYIIDRYENFDKENLKRIKGAVYLSVPFTGAGLASILPRWVVNKQINSLRKESPLLSALEENWNKYFFRGGIQSLPEDLRHKIPQLALYGAQDRVVSKVSASPLHLDAKVYGVDENHTSICKVNRDSTVFKHIKTFLLELAKERTASAMVLYVHGYDKQTYELQPDVELDWTGYFDVLASPRILPGPDMWQQSIATDLEFATKTWSQEWARKGGRIKIYSKLCLPGGVLIGNRFSRTKGAVIEVNHYKQLWSSEKADSSFKVVGKKTPGNNLGSSKAVVVLSVTNDIGDAVKNYLDTTSIDYRMAINVLPPNGVGHNSIQNAEQAVAYAMGVKSKIEELKNEGIEEINLFLNCPFSIAVFVGHYLTAVSPMKVFDFANPGYVESCHL